MSTFSDSARGPWRHRRVRKSFKSAANPYLEALMSVQHCRGFAVPQTQSRTRRQREATAPKCVLLGKRVLEVRAFKSARHRHKMHKNKANCSSRVRRSGFGGFLSFVAFQGDGGVCGRLIAPQPLTDDLVSDQVRDQGFPLPCSLCTIAVTHRDLFLTVRLYLLNALHHLLGDVPRRQNLLVIRVDGHNRPPLVDVVIQQLHG